MKLLYRTAEWHSLAKMRMHTDSTLGHLEMLTKEFGQLMRQFRDLTSKDFDTFELPREANARARRGRNKNSTTATTQDIPTSAPAAGPEATTEAETPARATRKPKHLNLSTYKFHALGDYVHHIRMFGGTDSFSTQLVCLSSPALCLLGNYHVNYRVNLLIDLSNNCMALQTSVKLQSKLLSMCAG